MRGGEAGRRVPDHHRRLRVWAKRRRNTALHQPRIDRLLSPGARPLERPPERHSQRAPAIISLKPQVKVLFASGSDDLIPTAIEHLKALYPELPTEVVSEFPPPEGRWIPYHMNRSFWENLALCRWQFREKKIRLVAVILQPRMPYWRLRFLALALAPWNFLAFNESFGHFMFRPRSLPTILRHLAWRTRNFFVWEFSPRGATYTFLWRLLHPRAFRRPFMMLLARAAGVITTFLKA